MSRGRLVITRRSGEIITLVRDDRRVDILLMCVLKDCCVFSIIEGSDRSHVTIEENRWHDEDFFRIGIARVGHSMVRVILSAPGDVNVFRRELEVRNGGGFERDHHTS